MEQKKFKLNVIVYTDDKEIKDKCAEALKSYLDEQGFGFDVFYTADNWQARLVDEKNELKEKLMKLIDFINSEKFYELSANNKQLLKNKKAIMELYLNILNTQLYEDVDKVSIADFGMLGLFIASISKGFIPDSKPLDDKVKENEAK